MRRCVLAGRTGTDPQRVAAARVTGGVLDVAASLGWDQLVGAAQSISLGLQGGSILASAGLTPNMLFFLRHLARNTDTVEAVADKTRAAVQYARQIFDNFRPRVEEEADRRRSIAREWVTRAAGGARRVGGHDGGHQDALQLEWRLALQRAMSKVTKSLSSLGLAADVQLATSQLDGMRRHRTSLETARAQPLRPHEVAQLDQAYLEWLRHIRDYVSQTRKVRRLARRRQVTIHQIVRKVYDVTESFAVQVGMLSGVSSSSLTQADDTNAQTLKKLTKLETKVSSEEAEAHARMRESLSRVQDVTAADATVRPANTTAGAAAGDAEALGRWRQQVWAECFGDAYDAVCARFSAPLDPREAPDAPAADEAYTTWDWALLQQTYEETLHATSSAEDAAHDGWVRDECSPIKSIVVRALRLEARSLNRQRGHPPTRLLSDYPLMATMSTDARDYDVYAWPLFEAEVTAAAGENPSGAPLFPRHVTLAYVAYAAMLSEVNYQMPEGDDGEWRPLPHYLQGFGGTDDGAVTPLTEENVDDLFDLIVHNNLRRVSLKSSRSGAEAQYTATPREGAPFAAPRPDTALNDAWIVHGDIGVRFDAAAARRRDDVYHDVDERAWDAAPQRGATPPEFYRLCRPPDAALDLRLADDILSDVALVLWTEEGHQVREVFWPTFADEGQRAWATADGSATVSANDGILTTRQGADLTVKVNGLDDLEDLRRRRVSAEREWTWYSAWLCDRPWLVAQRMSAEACDAARAVIGSNYPPQTWWGTGGTDALPEAISVTQLAPGAELRVGDVHSVRDHGQWGQWGQSALGASEYGVRPVMTGRVDAWFVRRCVASAPEGFWQRVHDRMVGPHLRQMRQIRTGREETMRAWSSLTADQSTNPLVRAAEEQRTRTLVYHLASKVASDIQREFPKFLGHADFDAKLLMRADRNEFFSNFYSMVAFEVMYHRRMNGVRTTYAGDARRQQQEYRLHKFAFRNARVQQDGANLRVIDINLAQARAAYRTVPEVAVAPVPPTHAAHRVLGLLSDWQHVDPAATGAS